MREGQCRDVHVTSNVELRNNVRLLLNVELRNYVISRQIVERRVTSDCYLNIVVSLQTCHNFVGGIRIFKAKICINPYHSPMHRCITTLCLSR